MEVAYGVTAIVPGRLLCLALPFVLLGASASSGADFWTSYQGGPERRGHVDVPMDASLFGLRWSRTFGTYVGIAQVTIGGGRVYVSDTWGGTVAGKSLRALDPATGQELWSVDFGPIHDVDQATYVSGRVYVQTTDDYNDSWLRCYDAATGSLVFETGYAAQWQTLLSPLVSGGRVVAGSGYAGGLRAYDAISGSELWRNGTVPEESYWSPATDGTRAYAYLTYGGRVGLGDLLGTGDVALSATAGPDPAATSTVRTFAYLGGGAVPGLVVPFPGSAFGAHATIGVLGY